MKNLTLTPLRSPPPSPLPRQVICRWHRFLAALVDGLIGAAIIVPAQWLTGTFQRTMAAAQKGGMFAAVSFETVIWVILGFVVMVGINWSFLAKGQTIGKMLLNIRISKLDGSVADRMQIVLKRLLPMQLIANIPVIGGIFSIVDCLMIFRSDKRMLHDMIAETKVVDLRPTLG